MVQRRIVRILADNLIPRAPTTFNEQKEESHSSELDNVIAYDVNEKPTSQSKSETFKDQEEVLSDSSSTVVEVYTSHRHLKNRHIQLIGIGGTVGTALFVSISTSLYQGGPLSLLLGFALWCIPILCVTVSTAEMVSYMPIESPFITITGIFCDEALEFMQGFNFWVLEAALIPFEITGVHTIIKFWNDTHNPGIELSIQIVLYAIIGVSLISVYGEVEFWLSIGKVILAFGLMLFTFFTMVGANPHRDVYGFRNWKSPAPMLEYLGTGNTGRFQGFLACLIQLSFTIAGPDYVSLTAINCGGKDVRKKILPNAFKQVFYRLTLMFIGGALCVGIVCSPRDPKLISLIDNGRPGAGQSPYIVAMQNLGLKLVLPHIVNALLVLALFSAGNSYTYCSSRTLFGLAKSGKMPKIFTYCSKNGVPLYCVLISLIWGLLSLLELGENSSIVLNWIVNLITACQLINYSLMSFAYYFFYKFTKRSDFDRTQLPFKSWGQPYTTIFGGICCFVMVFVNPYLLYYPSREYWDLKTFLFSFLMLFIDVVLYVGYKIVKRTKWKKTEDVDLRKYLFEIEEYELKYIEKEKPIPKGYKGWLNRLDRFLF